jgi:3-hydroxyisobutyrate dehydrogenase-like beta-hydroxyacid dehydrogenase
VAKLGFLGLGQMGAPMAQRLLGAGHDLTVWNRTPEKAESLVAGGAKLASTPAEAAVGAEATFTMLASPDALADVVWGRAGLAEGLEPGALEVEMSTVGPDAVVQLDRDLPDGIEVLDAPVLGSVPQAEKGELRIFVGGPEDQLDRAQEWLELMGTPAYIGPLGSGASLKLVINSTLGTVMTALAEALDLGDALSLHPGVVLDALERSPVGPTLKRKRPNIETGSYPPNFKLALARKDMNLVVDVAERSGLDPRLARAAKAWFDEADEAGLGAFDYSAVIAQVRGAPASY